MSRVLSDVAVREFHSRGFHFARQLFDADEIELLHRAAKEDHELDKRSFGRADGEGGTVRLSLWNHPGDGIYGMFARCENDGWWNARTPGTAARGATARFANVARNPARPRSN